MSHLETVLRFLGILAGLEKVLTMMEIAGFAPYFAVTLGAGVMLAVIGAGLFQASHAARRPADTLLSMSDRSDTFDLSESSLSGRANLELFSSAELKGSARTSLNFWGAFWKRVIDIVASLTLLTMFAPLLLLVALLVKVESPGPVIYRQTRVGLRGRVFQVYKFRSMMVDAEQNGAQWADIDDSRVTRIGSILRKTHIDEAPQALNVLKGEMSFVGPRPERPEFVNVLEREIPLYHERHRVKPGITGWAQVKYAYGASVEDAREKLKFDLFYLKNFNPLFDILIILMTIRVAFFGIGSR